MPRMFRGLVWGEVAAVVIAALIGVVVGFRLIVPPGLWFQVGPLEITSAARWQDVRVTFDRTILREFHGTWRVEVERRVPIGWEEVCATDLRYQTYTPDAVLPDGGRVTLDWFTGPPPACYELEEAGRYRLCAYWTINNDAWLGVLTRRVQRCGQFEIVGA